MSAAKRASETVTDSAATGFAGWSPENTAEASAYSVAAANAGTITPDRVTGPAVVKAAQRVQGG